MDIWLEITCNRINFITFTSWITIVLCHTLVTGWKFIITSRTCWTFVSWNIIIARTFSIMITRLINWSFLITSAGWNSEWYFLKCKKYLLFIFLLKMHTFTSRESKMFSFTNITFVSSNTIIASTFSTWCWTFCIYWTINIAFTC